MSALFVTGGSGFIGRRFLGTLDGDRWERVQCLSRSQRWLGPEARERVNLRVVTADLLDVDRYLPSLAGCDTVVHLAATTGKAARAEYFRVNTEGTRAVLEASRRAGVARFLYVSSIAARFAGESLYYYAESKRRAEEAVRASGLSFTIVRPTIVIGKGGASWESLSRLAALPLIPVLGNGTRIQPVYVDDVARWLHTLLASPFRGRTIELGGPEVTTFGSLLRETHYLRRGRRPWTIKIPVKPIASGLAILEKFMSFLPLNAGQLAAFRHDGTVGPADASDTPVPMRTVSEMLKLVIADA
jgi:nucleoside-diphosphate-sugar epimerase